MKTSIKILLVISLSLALIGCGGGGDAGGKNESFAGGPSGTGVGTRVQVEGVVTDQNGEPAAEVLVGDRESQRSVFTDAFGTYSISADKTSDFRVALFVRNDATNNEQNIDIEVGVNNDRLQLDLRERSAGGGFDAEFEAFNSQDLGGFITDESQVGGNGGDKGGPTLDDAETFFENDNSNPDQTPERSPGGTNIEEDIDANSFEAEFNANRGGRK